MLTPQSTVFTRDPSAERAANAWRDRANSLEKDLYDERCAHMTMINLINENADANRLASGGNTVAGYTNNLAQEMMLLRNDLVHGYAGHLGGNPGLAMPFGYSHGRHKALMSLTQEQRREINLRLMCRAEWYDWCMHVEVMSKFGMHVTAAFLNPAPHNAHIRNRDLLERYQHESERYHRLRDRAKTLAEGEALRNQFEQERYQFWKPRIRYGNNPTSNCPFPSTEETRKAWPDIRFDLHLPAGRLAQAFGVNIETGEKARVYRERTAGAILGGNLDRPASAWYV